MFKVEEIKVNLYQDAENNDYNELQITYNVIDDYFTIKTEQWDFEDLVNFNHLLEKIKKEWV